MLQSGRLSAIMLLLTSCSGDEDRRGESYGANIRPSQRTLFCRSMCGGGLVEANVGTVIVIVSDILTPKPAKVIFIERNNAVEQFATRTAHPAFGGSVGEGGQLHGMVTLPIRRSKSSIVIIH